MKDITLSKSSCLKINKLTGIVHSRRTCNNWLKYLVIPLYIRFSRANLARVKLDILEILVETEVAPRFDLEYRVFTNDLLRVNVVMSWFLNKV